MSAAALAADAFTRHGKASETSEKASRKVSRVQLDLPPRSMERLTHLKEQTEASSYAEVIKNALRLYEAMFNEASQGKEFFIKSSDGTLTPYRVFLEA